MNSLIIGVYDFGAGGDVEKGLYYVTPDVTLGHRFPGFVRATTPFISLVIHVDMKLSNCFRRRKFNNEESSPYTTMTGAFLTRLHKT